MLILFHDPKELINAIKIIQTMVNGKLFIYKNDKIKESRISNKEWGLEKDTKVNLWFLMMKHSEITWVVYMSLHWFLLALESHDLTQVWLNVFWDQWSRIKSDWTYFRTSGPEIRSVRLGIDHVTPKPKETSVTTCRRPLLTI